MLSATLLLCFSFLLWDFNFDHLERLVMDSNKNYVLEIYMMSIKAELVVMGEPNWSIS